MLSLRVVVTLICIANLVHAFLVSTKSVRPKSSNLFSEKIEKCDVAIFGGGFGGLYTALAVSREARIKGRRIDVAIVEPSDQFIFLPLLYDLTVGTATESEVCPYYDDILQGTGVRHIKATFDNFASPDLDTANLTTSSRSGDDDPYILLFERSVVAVGATPESTLASVSGASKYAQPFYTQKDAKKTRALITRLESQIKGGGDSPNIAVIGGGFGGVELAACMKRRLPESKVSLLTRGPPMQGTRAEKVVDQALTKLGVKVEICSVKAIEPIDGEGLGGGKVRIRRCPIGICDGEIYEEDTEAWDTVLWTAGSGPAYPVSDTVIGLDQVESGRLAVDSTLRCFWKQNDDTPTSARKPRVWALGDCSEIVDAADQPAVPKTAQAAIQQADVVAHNIVSDIQGRGTPRTFKFRDSGSLLTLGGPNGALMAPRDDSLLAPIFTPFIDTARISLGFADEALALLTKSSVGKSAGFAPVVENLGLSLGGYGLGVDPDAAPGTVAGTLTGAARRAIYAVAMPTNRQRAYAAASAAISTAVALAKEASNQFEKNKDDSTSK